MYLCAPGITSFPIDCVSGIRSTTTGGIKVQTPSGPALQNFAGSAAESSALNITSGPFTIWAAVYITETEFAYAPIFSRFSYASEVSNTGYGIETDSGLHFRFLVGGNNGTASYACTSPTGYAPGIGADPGYSTVAGTSNASIRTLWIDGELSATNSNNLAPLSNTTSGLISSNGATQKNSILVGAIWGRALSKNELKSLQQDPWQLFKQKNTASRVFGGFTPTPITTVVKAKGKGIPPLRIPSSGSTTMAALSQAVFAVSADFDGTAELFSGAGVSQGSMTQDVRANNSGKVQSLIFSKYIPSAGSYYAIFTMGAAGNAAGALLEVANVAAASQIDQTATATGSSTSPSSGATSATTQAYEVVIGAIGTEGPGGDTQGSWSNGFQPIAYTGTTGGAAAANVSLSVGYKIVNATGAQTAAKTGITSRQWGAAVATYKGLVASAPAADPVTYLTTSPLTAGTVGDFYSEYFEVYGGVAPYTYAVQSGSLPGGLSLATDGGLSGTPTLAGVYTFTIRATDSAAETEDLACSLTISAAAAGRRKPKTHILTMPGRFF
jgi:hypothetical protein